MIRGAVDAGKHVTVFADETRPFLQGARLTAWELVRDGIETTVITDNMAGSLMNHGRVDLVVVGADRIAANGDTANKIGTYSVAVLAREHQIPFYVAAPLSTVDLSMADGSHIPIEERHAKEVSHLKGTQLVERSFVAARRYKAKSIGVAGGVSANSRLRTELKSRGEAREMPTFVPSLPLSTDNAAMIAAAGLRKFRAGITSSLDLNADPALTL